jgi:hypothetical protein
MREIDRTLPPEGPSNSETRAYWRLDSTAETCSDCNQRSVEYNPLTFTKDVA